ncbi:MAG: MAPEG family protein [Gammaproteobacteria bacterium]
MPLPITSFLVALFSILMVLLSFQVSLRRIKAGNNSTNGSGDETLKRRIRAHGNFIEYAPLAAISVGLTEFANGPRTLVFGLAVSFFASRVIHAFGMLYTSTPAARALAMLIQHASFLVVGFWLAFHAAAYVR